MSALAPDTRDIVVEEVFPHAPETIWRALTSGDLISRWLMAPSGFAPVVGTRFTFQTKAGGAWDGVIHCEVREVITNTRLVYRWQGGHPDNVGYGAPLDTTVTWTLARAAGGTRVRLVHAGFVVPRNQSALDSMGNGWRTVVPRLGSVASEQDRPGEPS